MHRMSRRLLALCCLSLATTAWSQGKFPDGPIKMVVPFAAGGGVDSAARLLAKQLGANLNVAVLVENRPGANGSVGANSSRPLPPTGVRCCFRPPPMPWCGR